MSTRTLLLTLSCALAALVAGLWLGGHPKSLPGFARDLFVDEDPALRAEIIDTIEDNYYRRVDDDELEDASLRGIVSALRDPYSHYVTPKEAGRFRESIQGEFDGVGMSVAKDRRGLRVLNVFDRSPAKAAGIRPRDLVVAVDGRSIAGVNSDVATARIKGRPGTSVRLRVVTPRTGRTRTLTLERARIEIPVTRSRLAHRGGRTLGVVQLLSFTEGAHGFLRRSVDRLLARGASGIVLDLRGNGGGLLEEARLVASIFIERGVIVSVRGRARSNVRKRADGKAISPRIPMVVLVDGGSASASEIVTGALRDRHRATVVGTHTFGKGLVQEVEPLSNGGVLDLTVARYYLPSGKTIGRGGIPPQVKARDIASTPQDEALPVALDALLRRFR